MKQPGWIGTVRSLIKILRGKPKVPAALAGNPLLQTILNRRSIRSFTAQPVPQEVFAAILEAGRVAPSTVNLQSWTFAVFDEPRWQQVFGRSIPFHGSRAVIVIADWQRYRQVLSEFPDCPLTEYTTAVMNASLAAMNMTVAAEALGVSSVMLSETGRSGVLDAKYLKGTLNLPAGTVPLMTIVFGYARGAYPPMPPKLPLEQVSFEGQYTPPDRGDLESWLEQMIAGYNASHLGSSFQKQLDVYQSKISQAEADLQEMIFQHTQPT